MSVSMCRVQCWVGVVSCDDVALGDFRVAPDYTSDTISLGLDTLTISSSSDIDYAKQNWYKDYLVQALCLEDRQISRDLRTDISQQPHTIICRYIHSDGASNNTDIITGPNISGQFQIKTLRLEGPGCGLLPAVNDWVRVWMFDYKGSRGAGGAYNPPITPALASINQGNVIRFVIIRFKLKYHWRWKIFYMTAGLVYNH